MIVPMMQVWKMRMSVSQRHMPMPMTVGFSGRVVGTVFVAVVLVVNMAVLMLLWHMYMLMLMTLSQMQPQANSHQNRGGRQLHCDGFAEYYDC